METWWERALIPFVYCRLAAKFSLRARERSAAGRCGGKWAISAGAADAYEAVGGHAAVAREILEDVALARLVKKRGYGIYFTAPIGRGADADVPVVRGHVARLDEEPLSAGGREFGVAALWSSSKCFRFAEIGTACSLGCCILAGAATFALVARCVCVFAGMVLGRHVDVCGGTVPESLSDRLHPILRAGSCALQRGAGGILVADHAGPVVWKGRAYPARTP